MNTMLLRLGLVLCVFGLINRAHAQSIYYCGGVGNKAELRHFDLTTCQDTLITEVVFPPNPSISASLSDVAIAPDGSIYISYPKSLYTVNPQTGQMTLKASFERPISGLVCDVNGVVWAGGWALYSYDPIANDTTEYGDFDLLGRVGGDLTFRNGELFMIDQYKKIRKVNIQKPDSSPVVQDISASGLESLYGLVSVYYQCDSVVTYTTGLVQNIGYRFAEVDFGTGNTSVVNCNILGGINGATTSLEFLGSVPCLREFDLDTDNSTGATGKDYATLPKICPRDSLPLADTDLKLLYYKHIDSVQVYFLPGSTLPDGNQERLFASTGTTASGLNVVDNGTGRLTIVAKPAAPDSVFRKVLATAVYHNSAAVPTPGLRSIRLIPWSAGKVVDTAMAFINLPATLSSTLALQACPGTTVSYDGTNLAVGETRNFALKNGLGCDSIVTVTVAALPISASSLTLRACPGSTAPYGSANLAVGETRSFALKNGLGCDSIVTVTVTALPVSSTSLNVKACPGGSYSYAGTQVPTGTTQVFKWMNWLGCDSLVTVNVSPLPISVLNLSVKTCPGTTYKYAGVDLSIGATQSFKFQNWQGCDSIVMVTVAALPTSSSSLTLKACPGGTVPYEGANLSIGASQSFTFKNYLGCDSVVTVTVTALPTSASSLTLKTCPGTTVPYGSADLGIGASQSFTFKNWLGCDSIVTVTVAALPTSASSLTLRACPGSTVPYGGVDLAVGDVRDFKKNNWLGCDSVVTVTVAALPTSASSLTLSTCPGSTVPYGGVDLAVGDVRDFKKTNWLGCDSVVTVTVAALSSSASSLTLRACPGSTVPYSGLNLAVGDVRDFKKTNWLGCDSVVTVTVAALPVLSTALNVKVCPGTTYIYEGVPLAAGETRDFVLKSHADCDSTVTVSVAAWPGLMFGIVAKKSCANTLSGSLTVQNLIGGAPPLAYSLDGAGFQDNPDFAGLAAGTYTLLVRDSNQCIFEDTASVGEYGTLEVSLADAVLACDQSAVRMEPVVSGDLTGLKFEWSNGSKSSSLEATAAGVLWVEVSNVCQKIRREAVVRWNDFGGDTSLVYVPNAFSPSAKHSENLRFRPFFSPHLTVVDYQLEVYDRWGSLVFRSKDPEQGWEAVANRHLDDAGAVYIWHLQARVTVCGREMLLRRQGDVTVAK